VVRADRTQIGQRCHPRINPQARLHRRVDQSYEFDRKCYYIR